MQLVKYYLQLVPIFHKPHNVEAEKVPTHDSDAFKFCVGELVESLIDRSSQQSSEKILERAILKFHQIHDKLACSDFYSSSEIQVKNNDLFNSFSNTHNLMFFSKEQIVILTNDLPNSEPKDHEPRHRRFGSASHH